MSCIAYEIYKESGGKTWEGKEMISFDEMDENIKNAWLNIDKHFENKKKETHKKIMTVLMNDALIDK